MKNVPLIITHVDTAYRIPKSARVLAYLRKLIEEKHPIVHQIIAPETKPLINHGEIYKDDSGHIPLILKDKLAPNGTVAAAGGHLSSCLGCTLRDLEKITGDILLYAKGIYEGLGEDTKKRLLLRRKHPPYTVIWE